MGSSHAYLLHLCNLVQCLGRQPDLERDGGGETWLELMMQARLLRWSAVQFAMGLMLLSPRIALVHLNKKWPYLSRIRIFPSD